VGRVSSSEPPYADGERALRPASYDAEQVAAAARLQDPGLPAETAALLADRAWPLLREVGELDAPALARALMTAEAVGATPANVVATAAVAFCQTHDLLL